MLLLACVFLVALGVDYNIFMGPVEEEAPRLGTRRGTPGALAVSGGVITSAGIILAATFPVPTVLPLVLVVELFLVAAGVLLDTLIVRSLFVAALDLELDRRVWWPSWLAREPSAAW